MQSKVLIATTCRWFSAARLAMAFSQAGCIVEMACPSGHPALRTSVIHTHYPHRGLTPLRSLRSAILSSQADLIVPCDELTMRHLHHLYDLTVHSGGTDSKRINERIAFSLGDPDSYPITRSRDRFINLVHEEGIRTPTTRTIPSIEEMQHWLGRHGLPAALKADGTSGGEGVRIVHTLKDAIRAHRILRAPLATMIVAKRTLLDRDWNHLLPWLRQHKRSVSIQSFVDGPELNIAVACWQGEILASISVEVLETWCPKGPSTLIRVVQSREMLRAAEKIVRRLKFSGLCGFDFIIEKDTGNASLIEMNARATQTATLTLGSGSDLIGSLCAAIAGKPQRSHPMDLQGDTIALFPLAWQGNTSSEVFQSAYHDIPWEEPELVQLGMDQVRDLPHKRWIRKLAKLGQQ